MWYCVSITLFTYRLLKNSRLCNKCRRPMSISKWKSKSIIEGFIWFCNKDSSRVSLRQGSLFEASSYSLKQFLFIVYGWSLNFTTEQLAREARMDKEEVANLAKLCRTICELWLKKNSSKVGGIDPQTGCPLVVQLELNEISRPRTIYGTKTFSILSGIDKATGEFFIVEVSSERPETVEKAITDYVQAGTKVVTEGSWAHNIDLGGMGYVHHVVVSTEEGECLENDDGEPGSSSLWSQMRRASKMHSQSADVALESYLHQWLFQNRAKAQGRGIFESFLLAIQVSFY